MSPWIPTLAIALFVHLAGSAPARAAMPAATPAGSTVNYDRCSWNRPGVNPFMGDVVAAVDRYRDIPPEIRDRLKARMAKREYDDLVSIRRDSITGRGGYDYSAGISDMHFGTNQVCRTVTRASWSPAMEERGLVYCESGLCILVPTVCRNVSRIGRRGVGNEVAEGLPPFLPPGAGRPGFDDPAGAIEPLDAMPMALEAFPATAAGFKLDGGPIGQGPSLGSFASLVPGGVGGYAFGGTSAPGGGGGGGGGGAGGVGGGGIATASGGPLTVGEPVVVSPAVAAVPEPASWVMLLAGAVALFGWRRARRGPAPT